jgi:hypothetical protein
MSISGCRDVVLMEDHYVTILESTDLEQARQYFGRVRTLAFEVTKGLSEAQWRFKPAAERWSIAEILEHMVVVEDRVLGPVRERLRQAPPPPVDQDCHEVDAIILERIPDRSMRAEAPEMIRPTGLWTLPETIDRLLRNYERLTAFVESTPELREHALESPPLRIVTKGAMDTMDGYQWALTAAAHDERHIRQILEVKDDPNYPA